MIVGVDIPWAFITYSYLRVVWGKEIINGMAVLSKIPRAIISSIKNFHDFISIYCRRLYVVTMFKNDIICFE